MAKRAKNGWRYRHSGYCWICGSEQKFQRVGNNIRGTYNCPQCRGSLRYQAQARAIVNFYGSDGASLRGLMRRDWFKAQSIYEPGTVGPFRRFLRRLPSYRQSGFWPDVDPGEERDGVQCQDITHLTYDDAEFDFVISSDIFEHVRRPWDGFREVLRVLRPGGAHIFSVPTTQPIAPKTVYRVDTSGDEDVHLLEPQFHGPTGTEHLVYTDFGADTVDELRTIGFDVRIEPFSYWPGTAEPVVTFVSVKAG